MNVRVKICGLTRIQDALDAVGFGADALGFNFFRRSPRFVTSRAASRIIAELPPFVSKVGVFVNASRAEILRTIDASGIDTIQLHGDESPDFCEGFDVTVIKAFRIGSIGDLRQLPKFRTAGWLLDSAVPGQHGGTGAKGDWSLARKAVALGRPVLLAGGLNSHNVAQAIRQVRPFAVDVSSGVESSPGVKDTRKVRAFIRAAKG